MGEVIGYSEICQENGLVLHVFSVDADLIRYRHAKGGFIGLLDSSHSSCD